MIHECDRELFRATRPDTEREDPESLIAYSKYNGALAARRVSAVQGTSCPEQIAAALDLCVVRENWSSDSSMVMLGTYAGSCITVFTDNVEYVSCETDLSEDTVFRAAVAHELSHHVFTATCPRITSQYSWKERIRRLFRDDSGYNKALREIAAHAFVMKLVDIAPLSHPNELIKSCGSH